MVREVKSKIIRNKVRCEHRLEIIESIDVHDLRMCECGKVGVDGGTEYLKRIGSFDDYEEISIMVKE
ncbi:DUF7695 domain-containing protein [Paenibacillus guangzhouensis]